ncbi:MAG: sodium:proline symporter, partial [Thermomonas sp.]|nr:sodium:proline symporter [Thermomonas sp.]
YHGFVRKHAGERELVWVGRAMVLAVALLAIFIARDPDSRVLGLVSYAWAGFGAAFGPVVLFSLFWGRMTRSGALAGMVVGAATVILWKLVAVGMYGSGWYEMIPGFAAACGAIVIASLLSPPPAQAVQVRHLQVQACLRESGY